MRSIVKTGFLTFALAVAAGSVMAEEAATTTSTSAAVPARGTGPCKAEREKFCAGVEKGEGRIFNCLQSHKTELSSECSTKVSKWEERKAKFDAACNDDRAKFCSSVATGSKEMRQCMDSHLNEMTSDCKDLITKVKAKHQERKDKRQANKTTTQ